VAEWFEDAFREDYLRVYAKRDDATAAAEARAWAGVLPGFEPGRRVLDLCCGAGRHLRAMAAMGIAAVGCDLSPDLLGEARRLGTPRLVRADMRRLPFRAGAFDLVTSFFTSFGYFRTGREDAAAVREAARVLATGGALLLDLPDPESTRRGLVRRSEECVGDAVLVEERSVTAEGRVEKRVTLRDKGRERSWTESVMLYAPEAVEAFGVDAGLVPVGRFGGHGPDRWKSGVTPRCVLLLRKEAE
jgi:SAM-dependent methyltransferase